MSQLSKSKSLIIGLGKTGLSCARFLSSQGVPVAIIDSREQPPGLQEIRNESPDTALFLGGFDAAVFESAEQLVVSPGVAINEPLIQKAVERGVPVVGDIELFAQVVKAPVVAITGSNGKSTVTTLVGQILKAAGKQVAVGGNLGEPALNLLQDDIDIYVLELSSFQLETTQSLKPEVAVVLNISADHMDRYEGISDYANTKASIYNNAKHCVFNYDDNRVSAMSGRCANEHFFTLQSSVDSDFSISECNGVLHLMHGNQPLLPVTGLKVPGLHNVANALAALAIAHSLSVPIDVSLQVLRQFTGLTHRMQLVAESSGVRWYNDSKGTNVGACVAALEGFSLESGQQKTILIAGGDGKGADFCPLREPVSKSVRSLILMGHDAATIHQAIGDVVEVTFAKDMCDAVSIAKNKAEVGDRVLLSPACASFDMFANYQQRGEQFIDAVEGLTK